MNANRRTSGPDYRSWHVFISYSREDFEAAKALHDALVGCVSCEGTQPSVFLDREPGATQLGTDWKTSLENSIENSDYFIALFSPSYFTKDICQKELHHALKLHTAESGRVIPLVITQIEDAVVPYLARDRHRISTTKPAWFDEVCTTIELARKLSPRRLRWITPVADIAVNHTLPDVRVAVEEITGATSRPLGTVEVMVTASPSDAGLIGRTSISAINGVATFTDLFFQRPASDVTLTVSAAGCQPTESNTFSVRPIRHTAPSEASGLSIEMPGKPYFFDDEQALAVLQDPTRIAVFPPGRAHPEGEVLLRTRLRLFCRGPHRLAFADWSGRVVIAAPDGAVRVLDLRSSTTDHRLRIPGALAFGGDTLLVGMWNGEIWAISSEGKAEHLWTHTTGVQLLTCENDHLLVAGTDGKLTVHVGMQSEPVRDFELEPLLLGMTHGDDYALIVGEERSYRLDDNWQRLLPDRMPTAAVTGTLPDPVLTAVVDADGRGVCFDTQLRVRAGFHTVPGARPVMSARAGTLLVFEYPDGQYVVIADGRVEYTSAHPLALSPDGGSVAASDGSRILVRPTDDLLDDPKAVQ